MEDIWYKVFFRVWKSQYLLGYIFSFIKGTGKTYYSINSVEWMCQNRHFGLLKDKIENKKFQFKYDREACSLVSQNIELELFKTIYSVNIDKFQKFSIGVNEAAIKGNIEVIKYLVENYSKSNIGLSYEALDNACIHNQLEVLKYLNLNFPNLVCTSKGIDGAVEKGNTDCVRFLVERDNVVPDDQTTPEIHKLMINRVVQFSKASYCEAAKKGFAEMLKIIYEKQKLECDKTSFNLAALNGHLQVIKFLTENGSDQQCTVDAINYAAQNGHLEIIKYLHENRKEGCTTYAIDTAAKNGHLEVVKFLVENRSEGCTINAPNHAAVSGHLEVVEYLLDNRPEDITPFGFDYSCFNGNLPMVVLLHKRGKKCSSRAMDMAAQMGHLHVVEFLHINRKEGCTTSAMDLAALGGHFKVLEFLHNNRNEGCTENAIDNAAQMGYLNIVSFLLNNIEKPKFKNAINFAQLHGHFEIAELLQNNSRFQIFT